MKKTTPKGGLDYLVSIVCVIPRQPEQDKKTKAMMTISPFRPIVPELGVGAVAE